MQLPYSTKGLFLSCVEKFLLTEFKNRRKMKYIKSSINNLQPEIRQMCHSVAKVTMHLCQMCWQDEDISKCIRNLPGTTQHCLHDPDHRAITSGLFFTTTKNWNIRFDRGYFREEGEEEEEGTAKLAEETKVKDRNEKQDNRRKGMESGGRESRDSKEGHRKRRKKSEMLTELSTELGSAVTKSSH